MVGPWSFYLVRILLGAAEAGFFPGVILYLTYWFPSEYRGRIVAIFMVAIPLSSFLGSPISAALLGTDGMLDLHGWQWLFILEAVPAVLLGIVCLFVLQEGPANVKWLAPEQRAWLETRLESEKSRARPVQHPSLWKVLWNKHVLILALVYSGASATSNALSLWQPQIIKSFGLSDMRTGLLNSLPFAVASVAMIYWGRRSDRSGERVWNTALPLAVVAASLLCSFFVSSIAPMILILTLALTGTYAIKGPFWALSTEWLAGSTAAAGIAQVNALANLGAFAGSYLLGVIKDATGSYPLALLPLVALSAAGSIAVLLIGRGQPRIVAAAGATHHCNGKEELIHCRSTYPTENRRDPDFRRRDRPGDCCINYRHTGCAQFAVRLGQAAARVGRYRKLGRSASGGHARQQSGARGSPDVW